jgi:hypothetical protein
MTELERRCMEWAETPSGKRAWPMFEQFALEVASTGWRFGFRLIAERVRYEVRMQWSRRDAEGFKINNNYTPYIARAIASKYPHIAKLIETRRVRL